MATIVAGRLGVNMWVFIESEPGLWTVGFYDPKGKWHSDSDWDDKAMARSRVHYLNGGNDDMGRSC